MKTMRTLLMASLAALAALAQDPGVAAADPPPAPASTAHAPATAPLRVVALGDSVMWGQGLAEPHKFRTIVADWIKGRLGRQVTLESPAHSGAILGDSPPAGDTMSAAQPGEVPASYPSVRTQLESIANPETVDLVLLDGGANDVDIINILTPNPKEAVHDGGAVKSVQIRSETLAGARMQATLSRVLARFKNAKVVITGYYRMVSPKSEINGIVHFMGSHHIKIPSNKATKELIDELSKQAQAFYDVTNQQFTMAAAGHPDRVRFARIPWNDDYAYAAPRTLMWLAGANDEQRAARQKECAGIKNPAEKEECEDASLGHPNPAGALHYASAIDNVLTCDFLGAPPPARCLPPMPPLL